MGRYGRLWSEGSSGRPGYRSEQRRRLSDPCERKTARALVLGERRRLRRQPCLRIRCSELLSLIRI